MLFLRVSIPVYSLSPFPQIDIIGAMVIVWRVRGKIIRSVLWNIMCVMGGYSHLVPSGHLPRFSFSWFCVPVYNVVFMARAASPHRSPLPVVSRCSTQKRHVITCSPLPVVSRCSTQKRHVIT